jgi:hypothetical protein
MRRLLAVIVSGAVLAACGGDGASLETAASAPAPAGGTPVAPVEKGAAAVPQGAEKAAPGRQQAPQEPPHATVQPVAFEQLTGVLGDVDGWTRSAPTGEQMTVPVAFSRAEARYQKDQSRVTVEIQDTGLSQLLLAPLSIFMVKGFAERSSDGHRTYTEFKGQPALEAWKNTANRGELTVLVHKRFVIKGTGTRIESIDAVRRVLGGVDLPTLAALR